jgi:hypothetical protein
MIEYKQQTAVEWYDNEIEKLFNQFTIDKINIYGFRTKRFQLLEQAKEMEREQIKDAHEQGQSDEKDYWNIGDRVDVRFMVKSEEYYNKTYGGGNK